MLSTLRITNFRSLRSLSITGLTRVNLVLGGNNAGKTSILEAAEMLLVGLPRGLWRSPSRREEFLYDASEDRPFSSSNPDVDVRHLFSGHRLTQGTSFSIQGNGRDRRTVTCKVVPAPSVPATSGAQPEQVSLPIQSHDLDVDAESPIALEVSSPELDTPLLVPLTLNGTVSRDTRRRFMTPEQLPAPVTIITPGMYLSPGALWDKIVLTPEERKIVEALQIIEPDIERIAATVRAPRGSILVKLRNDDQPVPLGSMGDGTRYLLNLSMSLVYSGGGYLLVDEIDTGLHYSVMGKMWRLVVEAAHRLNVQVIASTHSLDCVRALAALCETGKSFENDVSVYRIERGAREPTRYSAAELAAAVRHEMEIR